MISTSNGQSTLKYNLRTIPIAKICTRLRIYIVGTINMKQALIYLLLTISGSCFAQESALHTPPPLFEGFQNFHLQINISNSLAQQYFDQGLALYYSIILRKLQEASIKPQN